jgi:hypothetical protein
MLLEPISYDRPYASEDHLVSGINRANFTSDLSTLAMCI